MRAPKIQDLTHLPSRVSRLIDTGRELAITAAIARDQGVQSVTGRTVSNYTTAASVAEALGESAELRAIVRDGHRINERAGDGYRFGQVAQTARVCDSINAALTLEKGRDALVSATSGTQVAAPSEEAVQLLPWREIAPPGLEPEFGRVSMELSKITSYGKPEVRAGMDGPFSQTDAALTPSTQRVGYLMLESSVDPLRVAQASFGQVDLSGLLDMIAVREMDQAKGRAAYLGDSSRGWLSAITGYATVVDKTSIAIDTGTVAAILAGVQDVIGQYEEAAGDGYPPTYCQLARDIATRLKNNLDNGISAWAFLRETYPNIQFSIATALKTQVTADVSYMIVGHRSPGPAGAPALGMQMLCADRDTVIVYTDGLHTRTLRVAAIAGSYSPYNDLQLSAKFDSVA